MISEIDIKDWKSDYKQSKKPVKLYDVPRGSVVTVDTMDSSAFPIHFDHVDGMYSYCWELNKPHNLVHLAAWTDVFVWSKK
jgi:hypothetical protein